MASPAQVAYEEFHARVEISADPWDKLHAKVKGAWRIAIRQAILAHLQQQMNQLKEPHGNR